MTTANPVLDSSTVVLVGTTDWLADLAERLETRTDATVQTVGTAQEARDIVRERTPDCLITAYAMEEATGLDLLGDIRDETTALPVVLATAAGSEAIASEAIDAGVTDYIALGDPGDQMIDDVIDRTERATRSAQRAATRRERARQFEAYSTIRGPRPGCSTRMARSRG